MDVERAEVPNIFCDIAAGYEKALKRREEA